MNESEKNVFYGGPLSCSIEDGCTSFGQLIIRRLYSNGEEVALIDGCTGEEITYHRILERSLKLANRFHRMGIKPGTVVAIASENSLDFPVVVFAASLLGATVLPLNYAYSALEYLHALQLTKPRAIFASPKPLQTILTIRNQLPFVKLLVSFGNERQGKTALMKDFFDSSPIRSLTAFTPQAMNLKERIALMVLSSGTTGMPKAVQLTHHNVMTVMAYLVEDPRYIEIAVPKSNLGLLPFYHVYGFMMLLNSCLNKVPMVVLPRFEPDLFLRTIQNHRISMLNIVPPIAVFLAKNPLVDSYDLSSLYVISCGAAPLSKEIEDLVLKRFPNVESIREGYGMSEASLGVISRVNNKTGSVGRVHKTTWAKVVDTESGKTLGVREVGEICVKGPLIMKGYLNNEAETKKAIDPDGWLHTGDVGYFDEDEDFYIVDRIKDLIKYKGYQVAPAELEDVLLSHPKIRDAAVVGVPDEQAGELPTAFVVLQPGQQLGEQDIKQFVASRLSPQKQLRGSVHYLEEIPKTGSGKILRRTLREMVTKKAKL